MRRTFVIGFAPKAGGVGSGMAVSNSPACDRPLLDRSIRQDLVNQVDLIRLLVQSKLKLGVGLQVTLVRATTTAGTYAIRNSQ